MPIDGGIFHCYVLQSSCCHYLSKFEESDIMSDDIPAVTLAKSTSKANDDLLFQLNSTMRIERIRQEASKHSLENFIAIAKRNLREKKKRMINDAERTDLQNAIAILQSNGSESSSKQLRAVKRKYDFEDVDIEDDEYYNFLDKINVKVVVKERPTRFQRQREAEYRQATAAGQSIGMVRKNETPKNDDESVDRFQPLENNNDNYITDDDENDSNSSNSSNCGAVDDDFIDDDDDDSVASSHKNSRAWLRLNAYFACSSRGKKCRVKRIINNNITKSRTTSNNNSDPSILRKLLPSSVKNENNAAVMTKEEPLCEKENANLSCKSKWKRCRRHKLYKRNVEFPVKHPVYQVVYARLAFERDVGGGMYATGFNNPLVSRSASSIGGHPSSPGAGLLRMLKNVELVDELLPKHSNRDVGGGRFYSPSQFHHVSQPHFGMPQLQGGFRAPYGPPFMVGANQHQYQPHHHQVAVGGGGPNMMTGGFYPNSQQHAQQSHQMMVGRVPMSSVAQASHHQHPMLRGTMDHHGVTHRVGGDSSTRPGGVGSAAAIRQMRLSGGAENASSAINMSNAFSDLEAIAEMASDETDNPNDGSGRPASAATTSPSGNAGRSQQPQSTPQQLSPMEQQHSNRSPNIARFRLMQQQHQQQSQQSVGAEVFDFMPDDCTTSGSSSGAVKPSNNSSFDDTSVAGNMSGRRASSGCGRATKSSSIEVDSVPGTPTTQPRRQRKPRKTSNAAASLPTQQQQPPIGYGLPSQQQIGFPSNVPHTAAAAAAAAAAVAEETRRMYEMEMLVDSSDDDEETDPPPPHRVLAQQQQQQAASGDAAATDASKSSSQQAAALTAQQQRLQRNAVAVAEQQQRKMSNVAAVGSKTLSGTATPSSDSSKSSSCATTKPGDSSPLGEGGALKKSGALPPSQTQSSSQQQKQSVVKREAVIDAESDGFVFASNKPVSSPKLDASASALQLKQTSTTTSMSAKFTTAIAQSTSSRQRDAAKLSSASLHSHRDATISSASKEVLKRKTSVSSASDAAKGAIKSGGGELKFVLKLPKGTTSSSAGSGSKSHHSSASPASSSSSGGSGSTLAQATASSSVSTATSVGEAVVRLSSHAAPPSKSKSTLQHHHSRMMYVDAQPQHRLGGSATAPSASIGSSRKRAAASEEGSSSRSSKKRIRDAGGAAVSAGGKSTTTKRGSISSASGSSIAATTASIAVGGSSAALSSATSASSNNGGSSDTSASTSTPLDPVVAALPSASFFQSSSLRKFKIPKVVDADTTTNSGNTAPASVPANKPESSNTASPSYGSQSGGSGSASTMTGSGTTASSGPPPRGGSSDSSGGSSGLSHRRPNKSILRNPSASSSSSYGGSDRDRGRMGGAPPYRSGGGGVNGLPSKSRKPPLMPGHPRVPQLLLPGSARPPLPPPGSGGPTGRSGPPVWQSSDAPPYARGGSGGVPAAVDWAPAFSHHQQQLQSGGYGGLSNTFNPLSAYNTQSDNLPTRAPVVPGNNGKDYGGGGSVATDNSSSVGARNSEGDVPAATEEPLSPVEGLLIDEDE